MYAVYHLRSRGSWKYLCIPTALLASARKQCEVDGILHTCEQTTWRSPTAENRRNHQTEEKLRFPQQQTIPQR